MYFDSTILFRKIVKINSKTWKFKDYFYWEYS